MSIKSFSLVLAFILILASADAQTVKDRIFNYMKVHTIKGCPDCTPSDVHESTCSLSGKKNIEILFIVSGHVYPSKREDAFFAFFTDGIGCHIRKDILSHYPEYERLIITSQYRETNKKQSRVFYLLSGEMWINDNGTAKKVIND